MPVAVAESAETICVCGMSKGRNTVYQKVSSGYTWLHGKGYFFLFFYFLKFNNGICISLATSKQPF